MKKIISALFLIIAIGMLLCPFVLIYSGIQTTPISQKTRVLTYDDIQKAKAIIKRIKPEYLKKKQLKTVSISEAELNLLLHYGVSHGLSRLPISSHLVLSKDHIKSFIALKIPSTPWGEFFNLTVDFRSQERIIKIHSARFGDVTIPGYLINPVLRIAHHIFMIWDLYENLFKTTGSLEDIRIDARLLTITYNWNPDTMKALHENGKALLLSPEKQQCLISYHHKLSDILSSQTDKTISLDRIMKPMFVFAAERSEKSGNPIMENTAVLQMLALYVTGTGLDTVIPKSLLKDLPPLNSRTILLNNRSDLAKHFLVSAALSVSTDSQLANFIGVAKEVDDSDGGSGFSFADLAADNAGVRFGETAIESSREASQFQKKILTIKGENAFMPAIDHLPEGIMRLEFKKKFKELDSASYAMITREIEDRIQKCEIYR